MSFATEGKEFFYGSVRCPLELWSPWRLESEDEDTISHWQCDVIIPEFNIYPRIPDDTLSYSINIIDCWNYNE